MKTTIATILTFILTISVYGNDGAYLTHGGVIYPTKESRISLEKEILSFSVRDKICNVDILFEFSNPDKVDRKLLIGFQAPTSAGDVSDEIANTNQIFDFKIISNGQILPYKIKAAECEDCELKELDEGYKEVLVYLFEITFKPGINKINHSYSFPASENVDFDQMYNYILTTGAKWSGGIIKNLTVQIDLGQNAYFYVNDVFGKKAKWSIIGTGKVFNTNFITYNEDTRRMARTLSGKLQIDVKNFKPTKNIGFGTSSENSFIDFRSEDNKIPYSIHSLELFDDTDYSEEELSMIKNTIYAQYGYVFKSKDLQDYFSEFWWYMPDPNLTIEQIKLTEKESKFIDEILRREKE